jgi:hypothetical protein
MKMKMCTMRLLALALLLLPPQTAAAQYWCWDADEVTVDVLGDSVRVRHLADLINCCPEPISWELFVGEGTLLVVEHWVPGCYCLCCFDLEMTMADVPPGQWLLSYRWFDIEADDWVDMVFEIELPDVGQGAWPTVVHQDDSGCLDPTSVPPGQEQHVETDSTWSTLKALYR